MSVKQMKNSGKKKAGAKTDLFEVKKTAKPLRSNAVKRHAKPAKGKTYAKRAKSPNGYCWWAAPLLLLSVVVVALLGVLACREYVAYASFQTQVESALNDTFFDGVCVDNWEMTGLNLADALTAFDARVESGYRNRSLYFDTGDDESFLLTCEELGYKSNYENVIGEAWHYGRSGSLEERYRSINDVSANKITFSVARTLYDPEKLRTVTDRIAQKYTREMKNAGITDFDFSTRTFLFSQEVSGSYVDGDALYRQACALLDNGGGILTIKIERQEPTITVADVRSYYGKITEAVKSGLLISLNGVKVFIPASQSGVPKNGDLSTLIGTEQRVKIIDLNEQRRRAVASIRAVVREEQKAKEAEFWANIEEGKKYEGVVKSITSYGAFVDLGGVDGMVHSTELSWKRIKHPSEVVNIGDTISVYVKNFDPETKRISLGYKTEETNPWNVFMNTYKVGDVAKVKIVSLMDFGAFAEVVPGTDGLIHISQIADRKINKPADVLEIGQEVDAKIIDIDTEKRKISLSIRALLEENAEKAEAEDNAEADNAAEAENNTEAENNSEAENK